MRILQEKWRSAGPVGKEHGDLIWQRFKKVLEKLSENRRDHLVILEKQQKENLASKLVLCEKLELLNEKIPDSHKKWNEKLALVEAIMEEWKKTGFAAKSDNDKIWNRFRMARKTFYSARDAFYENQRKEYTHNLNLKTDLCLQAEALKESTDWKHTADQLKKLQEQWKGTGPVPQKFSDKLWNRFRSACDQFFQNRKNHFAGQETEMADNLIRKNELLARMKGFHMNGDGSANIDAIKKFQNEWLSLGQVPFKDKDAVNLAYREVLDKLMKEITVASPKNGEMLFKMQYEHKASTSRGKEEIKFERSRLQEKISKLQKDVSLLENNIEFFGKSANADKMKEEFIVKINETREEIKGLKENLKMMTDVNN